MKKIYEKINKKLLINIIIAIVSYISTYSLPYIIAFNEELTYSNSIVAVAIFVSFICLLKKTFIKENFSKIKNIFPLGIMLTIFLIMGNIIKQYGEIDFSNTGIYLAIIHMSFIMNALLVHIYNFIEKFENREEKEKKTKIIGKKKYFIIFCIIIMCWMPVFLAAYPGYFCYDAYSQYSQFTSGYITTWHPVIHTLMLGKIITSVANMTGTINTGIAVYSVFQMIVIAMCFTYSIYFLDKYKISKIIKIISVVYYAIFPVIAMFAMCSTKDSIFTAFVLMSVIFSIEALLDKEKFMNSKYLQIRYIVTILLAIMFRNNAIYAYLPFAIIFMVAMKKREIIITFTVIGVIYAIYSSMATYYTGAYGRETPKAEAFSVPLQQIARVYNRNFESLTEEELEQIYLYTDDEQLKSYRPEIADPMKDKVEFNNIGYLNFFKLWLEIGLKNPRNICRIVPIKYIRILVSRYYNKWI